MRSPLAFYLISKLNNNRSVHKRTDGRDCVFHIKYLRIAVVFIVHTAKIRICIKHRFSRFNTVVFNEFAGNTNPRPIFERTKFCFWIYRKLTARRFYFARLYVEFAFKLIHRSKWTNSRLLPLNCCQIIHLCVFKKFINSLHSFSPYQTLSLNLLYHNLANISSIQSERADFSVSPRSYHHLDKLEFDYLFEYAYFAIKVCSILSSVVSAKRVLS